MQFQPQGKPSVGIVFDADLGNTIDDALALAMLYGFQGKNEARVLSVSTTKSSLNAAIFADVLVRFYTGEPNPFFGVTPIGLCLSGKMAAPNPMLDAVVGKNKVSPQHRQDERYRRSPGAIRNALSAQVDQNAIVVLSGPATNLAAFWPPPATQPLIAQKVRSLVVAADALTLSDIPAAKRCSPSGRPRSWSPAVSSATPCPFPPPASKRISPGRRRTHSSQLIEPTAPCLTMPRPSPWPPPCTPFVRRRITSSCPTPAPSPSPTTGLSAFSTCVPRQAPDTDRRPQQYVVLAATT